MKPTSALLVFSLCAASCLALRQTRSLNVLDVASNFSSSKLPMMLNIPQYKRDCWQKRPVYSSLLQNKKDPGAGLEPFTPYELVLKDGFMPIDCVKDKLFLEGDKFGDGKFSYNLENVSNVSIIHYTEIVPKEDRKPMTQKVCFEFCRTVPEMGFFGIFMGRDCYCTPYYKMVADDSSMCDQLCEGDTTLICGGKSKSSIFSMHMCSSTASDLKKAEISSNRLVGHLQGREALAQSLADKMQASAELNQKIFGMAGDPASSDLMQMAKVFAGELEESVVAAARVTHALDGMVKGAREMEKDDFDKSDTVTAAERLMEKMDKEEEEGTLKKEALGKIIKLAHPGEEELGSAKQYYPVMYFVDKKYTETMTTCKGPLVDKPIVGESIDGCASACDAEIHNCVGFMYYGTGDASLCFLYSGFKSAMYWTGCHGPAKKEFLQIQEKSSSGMTIAPWGCGDTVSLAWQSQTTDAGETSIQRLNTTTGEYELVFNIPTSRTSPEFRSINSCAINGKDGMLYCSMQINNAGSFLVRIDAQQVGFVSKLPEWQYSGTFDKDGNYYCNGAKSWSVVTGVANMATQPSLYDLSGSPYTENFVTENSMGADLVSFEADLNNSGVETYIMTVEGQSATLIRVSPLPYMTSTLRASGLPSGKTWASGWTYKSTVFFAAEDGSGVYQVDLSSVNLLAKTLSFKKEGTSAALVWNDGFSCPDLLSPFVPTLPPNPTPFDPPTTTTTTTTEEEREREQDPTPPAPTTTAAPTKPPPKVGQVKCMAKLSKFEGTTLKPDPSGKCKQCMKKLVNAQRCYE